MTRMTIAISILASVFIGCIIVLWILAGYSHVIVEIHWEGNDLLAALAGGAIGTFLGIRLLKWANDD